MMVVARGPLISASADRSALEFLEHFDGAGNRDERRSLLHALLNRVDGRTIADAVKEAKARDVSPLSPTSRFRSELRPRPRVGVGVVVFANGGLLLHRRKHKLGHGHGEYSLPGGHLEHGQTFHEAAAVELKQECGLDLHASAYMTAINTVFPSGRHYVTVFVRATRVTGTVRCGEPDKGEHWGFYPLLDPPQPLWSPVAELLSTTNEKPLDYAAVMDFGRQLAVEGPGTLGYVPPP